MCPFVEESDARCAAHLNMQNLFQAFTHCADHYEACPIYQELLADERTEDYAGAVASRSRTA